MNISFNYQELADFIEMKFKLRPTLMRVNEKTLELSYTPNSLLPSIDVQFTIEGMRKDVVCLSYVCSDAVSLIISGVVAYLEDNSNMPGGIGINTTSKRVNVFPMRFKQLDGFWDYALLSKIVFDEKQVNLEFSVVK